jgi:hypothetical protein
VQITSQHCIRRTLISAYQPRCHPSNGGGGAVVCFVGADWRDILDLARDAILCQVKDKANEFGTEPIIQLLFGNNLLYLRWGTF